MPTPPLRPLCSCVAALSLFLIALVGCAPDGNGGAGTDNGGAATCAALDRLAAHATAVERIDVADPDTFTRALDRRIDSYVEDLTRLRRVAPDSLHGAIDSLSTTVRNRNFEAAMRPRSALAAFATEHCNVPASPTSRGG
jgi:hypothetical protein